MKEGKLSSEEIQRRSRLAEDVISNPVVREALDGMRERAQERWLGHGRVEDREEEWRFMRTIDEFERLLHQSMALGRSEAERAERSDQRRRRLVRAVGLG